MRFACESRKEGMNDRSGGEPVRASQMTGRKACVCWRRERIHVILWACRKDRISRSELVMNTEREDVFRGAELIQ